MEEIQIQIEGKITNNNFKEVKESFLKQVASIPTTLVTDDDFIDAKENVKSLAVHEKAFLKVIDDVMAQFPEFMEFVEDARECNEVGKRTRLALSKTITSETIARKEKLVSEILSPLTDEYAKVADELIREAIKGKSKRDAILEAGKEVVDELVITINANTAKLNDAKEAHGNLVMELNKPNILIKDTEIFNLTLENLITKIEADVQRREQEKIEREKARAENKPSPTPTPAEELDEVAIKKLDDVDPEAEIEEFKEAIVTAWIGARDKVQHIDNQKAMNEASAVMESILNKL